MICILISLITPVIYSVFHVPPAQQKVINRIVGIVVGRYMQMDVGDPTEGEALFQTDYILKVVEPARAKVPLLPAAFNAPTDVHVDKKAFQGSQKIDDGERISTERKLFNEV